MYRSLQFGALLCTGWVRRMRGACWHELCMRDCMQHRSKECGGICRTCRGILLPACSRFSVAACCVLAGRGIPARLWHVLVPRGRRACGGLLCWGRSQFPRWGRARVGWGHLLCIGECAPRHRFGCMRGQVCPGKSALGECVLLGSLRLGFVRGWVSRGVGTEVPRPHAATV